MTTQHSAILNAQCHEPRHITDAVTSDNEKVITPDSATAGTSSLEYLSYPLTLEVTDISTAGSSWIVAPFDGTITRIYSVIDGTIATSDATLTAEIGGVLVTDSSITVTQSGSMAGDVDFSTPSAANTFTAGQTIEIITDGASSNSVKANITIWTKRTG